MRALSSSAVLVALVALVLAGCGAQPTKDADFSRVSSEGALSTCTLDLPTDVTTVFAWNDGIVFARGELVQRMHGAGCALAPSGAPVAAEQLLDVDDHGALYVFPAEATTPGAVSTMLEGEYRGSMVARVAHDGGVTKLMSAGRGIWGFGVAPLGDALWQDACGPSGVFDVTPEGVSESTFQPSALWGVLTDARTFWSVARSNELVRTTADGSVELGATMVDFGDGLEQGGITRCGANVCGVFASAVLEWDDEGAVVRTLTRDDVGAAADEQIASVTANRHGLYVTLRDEHGVRVVFVP